MGIFDLWKNRRVTAGSSESGLGQVRTIFSSGPYYDSIIEKKLYIQFSVESVMMYKLTTISMPSWDKYNRLISFEVNHII